MAFQPCIDGELLTELPLDAIRDGAADGVPLLVGTQRDEWRAFARNNPATAGLDEAGLVAEVSKNVDDAAGLIERYRDIRTRRGVEVDPVSLFAAIETDRKMRMPAIDLAEAAAARGQPAYHYIFAGESPWDGGVLGSPHAIIIGYVFGTHAMSDESAAFFGRGVAADTLSAHLQDAVLALATYGDPLTDALAGWVGYDTFKRSTAIFGTPLAVAEAPYEEERTLWAGRRVGEPFGASLH